MPNHGGPSSRAREGSTGHANRRGQVTSWLSFPHCHLLPPGGRKHILGQTQEDSGIRCLSQYWGPSGGTRPRM